MESQDPNFSRPASPLAHLSSSHQHYLLRTATFSNTEGLASRSIDTHLTFLGIIIRLFAQVNLIIY
jgi:hypothetical protein